MRSTPSHTFRYALFCLLLGLAFRPTAARAEAGAGGSGRGGPFVEYHFSSMSNFDPSISGNPIFLGGVGFGFAAKNFRLGGGGAGGFLWNPSGNVQFGTGYGGVVGEYTLAPWLNARLLIGGGGYAVAKVLTDTDTTTTLQKLGSGGFVLFYPSVSAEFPLDANIKVAVNAGYFLPNITQLESFTVGINFLFGK